MIAAPCPHVRLIARTCGQCAARIPGLLVRSISSVLAATSGSLGILERPDVVCELQHQEAVILARAPKRPVAGVPVNLRTAPIGSTRTPLTKARVVRTRRCYRHARRIEVGDFLRSLRMTNVEHSNPGIEVPTRQRSRVVLVVYAAVVTAIGEY